MESKNHRILGMRCWAMGSAVPAIREREERIVNWGLVRWLLKIILTLLGFVSSAIHATASFGVDGFCIRDDFDPKGRLVNSVRYEFTIVVDGHCFDLIMKEAGSEEDFRRVVSDGTNTFYLSVFEKALERMKAKGQQVGENVAGAAVLKRSVPNMGSFSPAGEIWLAYGSGSYFAEFERTSPTRKRCGTIDLASGYGTASGLDVEHLRETRPACWELLENGGAPEKVTFYERGFAQDGSFRRYRLPAPYSDGFTNSVFAVLRHTNTEAGVFAVESVLTSYWIKSDGVSSNDLWARHMYKIVGTNFYDHRANIIAPPILPGTTMIVDGRFVEDVDQPKSLFSYLGTKIPSETEVRSTPAYRSAKPRPPPIELRTSQRSSRRVYVVWIALAVTTLVPVLILLRQRLAILKTEKNHKL